ncbi:hypothetical protein [Natronospora cellulosivora (SeqCode)]
MFKNILLIILIIIISAVPIFAEEDNRLISGLITGVDLENNSITLDNKDILLLAEDCSISRNDISTALAALKPISTNFYQWAELDILNSGVVININAYYQVIQGIIEDISHSDKYIKLSVYKERIGFEEKVNNFKWNKGQDDQIRSLKEGDYIVLITAKEKILNVIEY